MNDELRILKWLTDYGDITTMDAMKNLDIMDPQHYIMVLRRKGYQIEDEWEISTKGKRYKRYFLRKDIQNGKETKI